jgi:hypothetical protein
MSSFVHADIFINEFLANGIIEPDSEWVELYNNGSSSVDLTNYNITESGASANVTLNGTIPVNGFVVLAENFTLFNSTYPDVNISGIRIIEYGAVVASFQLHNTAGNITLYNSSGSRINNVSYSSSSENVSEGRFPDGNESFSTFTAQTPGAKNDNAAPVFNKWVKPSANASFIGSLFNVTVNITDRIYTVNTSWIEFNGTNLSVMNKSGDIWYYLLNTSKYLETAASSTYNITIHFNDSIGLSNSNTLFNISIDNTFPNITSPNTTSNSRNFVSPGFVFNASVNASDENLLKVTCLLDGTSYGYFANISNKTFICNLTAPLTEDTYTINFTVFDKANNTNTTTINFTTKHSTIGNLILPDVTVSDLNQSDKIIQVNVTLNNTGNNPMYDTGAILSGFSPNAPLSASSGSYSTCSSDINSSELCNATFDITVNGGSSVGTHTIFWNANWTNSNFTENQLTKAAESTVTISSNPQMAVTENISTTIIHGQNTNLTLDLNSTGNANLQDATITFIAGTLESSFVTLQPSSFSSITAGTNETFNVTVTIPKFTNPGNYTGTLNITPSSILHKTILVTVEVPTDDSWISFPNVTKSFKKTEFAGLLGNITINNSGNIGQNYSITYSGSASNSLFFLIWNQTLVDDTVFNGNAHVYVERNQTKSFAMFHKDNGPRSIYDLTITLTSTNTSKTNVSTANLTIDNNDPFVNITNPINNSFVKDKVEFNVTATDLNLTRLEYFINDSLVFDSTEINFTFNWNTTNGSYGDEIYTLKVIAYDSAGNSNTSDILSVTVNNTNSAPRVANPLIDFSFDEDTVNDSINLSSVFKSIDGESLTYANFINDTNISVSINQNTGIATLTPEGNWTGSTLITFNASDLAENYVTDDVIVTINNVQDIPSISNLTSPENNSVFISAQNSIFLMATSKDGDFDDLTFNFYFSNDSSNLDLTGTDIGQFKSAIPGVPEQISGGLTVNNLVSGKTYFWVVEVTDGINSSGNSSMFQFLYLTDSKPGITAWGWNTSIERSSIETNITIKENESIEFNASISDADGDKIMYEWGLCTGDPGDLVCEVLKDSGFEVVPLTTNLTYSPGFSDNGSKTLRLSLTDNNTNSFEKDWNLTITNINRDPVLDAIANKEVLEDSTLEFNITVIDPDNNSLTFISNITSISFTKAANNSLATVSWTPTNADVGNNTVKIVANDSSKWDSKIIVITVNNTNDPPTIASFLPVENKTIAVDVGIQRFDVTFSDDDVGDVVNATWIRNGTVLVRDSSNVTVTSLGMGIYNITAIVNDTSAARARYEWKLTVTGDVTSDELTSPVLQLNESRRQNATDVMINQSTFGGIDFRNETLNFSGVLQLEDAVNISDGLVSVDSETFPGLNKSASLVMKGLSFTKAPLINMSSGFESTAGGVLCPENVCTGITYDVANGILRFNVPYFSTYSTETNTTNGAPVITSTPITAAADGAQYTYNVDATDPDGNALTFSLITKPSDMSIDPSSGVISWTPTTSQLGSNNVTVKVSDGSLETSQSFEINVTESPKLIISDLDVKVGKKTHSGVTNNTRISKDAEPGSEVEFKIELKNLFTDDEELEIEDIEVEITIEDIDDGDDLDEEADDFDLKQGKRDDVKIKFDVPLEVEEGTFDVIIDVDGEDENRTIHTIRWELELEVEKENHEIRIVRSALTPSTIKCQRTMSINTEIINTGSDDEDEVSLEVISPELEINSLTTDIELDEGTDDNRFTELVTASISSDVEAGTYPITINTYYDSKLSETETVDLTVEDCERVKKIKKDVKEEKPKVEVIRPTIILEKKPEVPVEVSFAETFEYKVLLAILIVIFLGTAIFVAGAGFILLRK